MDTAARIVRAALELRSTSVGAIANRAGVSRPTVYAHFPNKDSLLTACALQAAHPPDGARALAIAEPDARLRATLALVYDYFRRHTGVVEFLGARLPESLLGSLTEGRAFAPGRKPLLHAAIAHALDFGTWRSFAHLLPDAAIAELMSLVVDAAARGA
jgi:AcrR family transcriptional regulator